MYWKRNSKRYEPDFVVETKDTIYLIEIKAEKDMDDAEVLEKTEAGKKYCEAATKFNTVNRGKAWKYILIPHNVVRSNTGFSQLVNIYEQHKK